MEKYNVGVKKYSFDEKSNWLKNSLLVSLKGQMKDMMNREKISTGEIKKKAATKKLIDEIEALILAYSNTFAFDDTVVVDYETLVAEKKALQIKVDAWKADKDLEDVENISEFRNAKNRIVDINKQIAPIEKFKAGNLTVVVTPYVEPEKPVGYIPMSNETIITNIEYK